MVCAEHIESIGKMRVHTEIWSKSLKGIDHLGHLGADDRIILTRILTKQGVRICEDWIQLAQNRV
jgi:hypothetical protein